MEPSETDRELRSDARLNQDRLLQAAAAAFARDGSEASLKSIAKDAAVGIATLYRRFPTREALIEAVYRTETERLCAAAHELASSHPDGRGLRIWMDLFVDYMRTKHGMAQALRVLLMDTERQQTRIELTEAIASLVRAGAASGRFRSDVEPIDVLMALGGITLIAGEPDQTEQARRLLDLLIEGLTAH